MTRVVLASIAVVLLAPAAAVAQNTATPPSPGPLVLERVETGFVVAPDYKITELGRDTAHLVGGHAGWLTDNTVFVGGAVYSVANRADDFGLTYGGLLVGWSMPSSARFQFGARGLVGVGTATLGRTIDFAVVNDQFRGDAEAARFGSRDRTIRAPGSFSARVSDDFFVVEPELTFGVRATRHMSLNIGAGYRLTGDADRLGDDVNGITGSVGVQIGGW